MKVGQRVSASNSFTEAEVELLWLIMSELTRGTYPKQAVRGAVFANVSRKILVMRTRCVRLRSELSAAECAPVEPAVHANGEAGDMHHGEPL